MSSPESATAHIVPRLTTARLLLREPRLSDFDEFAENGADAIARVHSGGTIEARDAWRRFHAGIGYWLSLGMGWWMVEKQGLTAVGSVGVFAAGRCRRSRSDGRFIGGIGTTAMRRRPHSPRSISPSTRSPPTASSRSLQR